MKKYYNINNVELLDYYENLYVKDQFGNDIITPVSVAIEYL